MYKFTEHDENQSDVTMEDVGNEIHNYFKMNFKGFKGFEHFAKPVHRKYGFELPDIPAQTQYLKVTYPFTRGFLNSHEITDF